MNGGLNSINGSIASKMDWMLCPLMGGNISKEKRVFPLAFLICSVIFIVSGSIRRLRRFPNGRPPNIENCSGIYNRFTKQLGGIHVYQPIRQVHIQSLAVAINAQNEPLGDRKHNFISFIQYRSE